MKNKLPSKRKNSTINFIPDKKIPLKTWGGAASGAGQGAALGATIGSVFPGAGTVIGGAIGTVTGGVIGAFSSSASKRRARRLRDEQNKIRWAGQKRAINSEIYQDYTNDANQLADTEMSDSNNFFMASGGKIGNKNSKSKPITLTDEELALHSRLRKNQELLSAAYDKRFGDKVKVKEVLTKYSNPTNFDRTKLNTYAKDVISQYNDYALTPDEIKNTLGNSYDDYIKDIKTYSNTDYGKVSPGFAGDLESNTKDVSKLRFGVRQLLERFRWNESMGSPYGYLSSQKNTPTKATGGKVGNVTVPEKNYRSLPDGAKLLTNNNGGTTGSHENGDNIPLKKEGNTVAYAEPGEIIVDNTVLSKRLGFADKYLQLEDMKKSIETEQRQLPSKNKSLIKNMIPSKRRVPIAFTGMDLMNLGQASSTVGNLLMSNDALREQEKDINKQMAITDAYRPTLNKVYRYNDNIDINDIVSEINRGYTSNISSLDNIDPTIASALKNTANLSRINQLSKIFGEKNRTVTDIRNKNVDIIRSTSSSNNALSDQGSQFRIQGQLQGLDRKIAVKGQRVTNFQNALSEVNQMFNDRLSLESINQRYANELGDRGLPKSMRTIDTSNLKDKFSNWITSNKQKRYIRKNFHGSNAMFDYYNTANNIND